MDLSGAVCLVTGASSGIGRATALRLAAGGATILAHGRDHRALGEVAAATGGVTVVADLAEASEVERCVSEALRPFGRVDVLVNNAASGWAGRFVEMDPGDVARLLQVNLAAHIGLTRFLVPGMVERGRGHVVNIASIAGHVGVGDEAVYAASKAGLIAFTESLRYDLAGSGVGVTSISPGVVHTTFFERRGRPYDRTFPRPIPPERVADAVVSALRRNPAHVFVPRWMGFPAWLHGTLPGVYRALQSRFGEVRR